MNAIVGNCPKCGAPIYAPSIWHGVTPPPSQHSCGCFAGQYQTTSGTDFVLKPDVNPKPARD